MTKDLVPAVALLLMFGAHLFVFMKYIKTDYSTNVRGLALTGCLIIVSYFVFGLTSAALERKVTLALYVFLLTVLLGKIVSLKKSESADRET
jgi:hypothetical protein